MSKDISEYIHYYIGQQCQTIAPDGIPHSILETINYYWLGRSKRDGTRLIPILRKLEDMTEEECWDIEAINPSWVPGTSKEYIQNRLYLTKKRIVDKRGIQPEVFHYLLSKGFDLFNLIESGAAIDAKTIQPQQQ